MGIPGTDSRSLELLMIIDPKITLGGVPVLRVRDFFRKVGARDWSWEWPAHLLKLPRSRTLKPIAELQAEGYVQSSSDKEYPWRCTEKGLALASARGTRPIARDVAQAHL